MCIRDSYDQDTPDVFDLDRPDPSFRSPFSESEPEIGLTVQTVRDSEASVIESLAVPDKAPLLNVVLDGDVSDMVSVTRKRPRTEPNHSFDDPFGPPWVPQQSDSIQSWSPDHCYSPFRPRHRIPRPCLLYTSPSPRDRTRSRMPSSA